MYCEGRTERMGDDRLDREFFDEDSGNPAWTEQEEEELVQSRRQLAPKWVIAKLVLGILSFLLFVFIMFQSCAAGLGNALSDNGEVGGSAGFLCAVNFMISGLIAVIARKAVKKAPMIVAAVFLWLNLLFAKMMAGSYSDLVIWGYLSFIFGLVYLFSVMRTRKQYLITGAVAVVFLVLTGVLGTASGGGSTPSAGTSENNGEAVVQDGAADAGQEEVSANSENNAEDSAEPAGQVSGEDEMKAAQVEQGGESWEVGEGEVVTYTDIIGNSWVKFAVPVMNTGTTNLYLRSGSADLEDATGHLVDSRSSVSVYPNVIKPGETAWYYEDTPLEEEPSSPLKVIPRVNVEKAKVDCIRYETSDVSFTEDSIGDIKVTGRVENTTQEAGSVVEVVILLYDAQEHFLGTISTYLHDDLNPGDKVGFSASSLGSNGNLKLADIINYRIYAYPTQFQF